MTHQLKCESVLFLSTGRICGAVIWHAAVPRLP